MSMSLTIAGILAFLAGLGSLIFGIQINEFSLGSTLIIAGAIGAMGGLILIGIAAALSRLRQIVDSPGVGSLDQPVRSLDSSHPLPAASDSRPASTPERIPFPSRPAKPAPVRAEVPAEDRGAAPHVDAPLDAPLGERSRAYAPDLGEPRLSAAPSISASHEDVESRPAFTHAPSARPPSAAEPHPAPTAATSSDAAYRNRQDSAARDTIDESDELAMRLRAMVETTAVALEKVRENAVEPRVAPLTGRAGAPPSSPVSPPSATEEARPKSFFDSMWPKAPSAARKGEGTTENELPSKADAPSAAASKRPVRSGETDEDRKPPETGDAMTGKVSTAATPATGPDADDTKAERFHSAEMDSEEEPVQAPIADADFEGEVEDEPVTILKSGVIDEMAYTLYSDGSIEAELPQGTVRFGSIAALRAYLENAA